MNQQETNIASPEKLESYNEFCKDTLISTLGILYTHASDQRIEAEMTVDERTIQPHGYLHGGASIALGETLAGLGSQRLCQKDEMAVGQQVNAMHVRPVKKGNRIKAIATLFHKGRKTHIWNVEVVNQEGKSVSSIRVVNFIVKKESGK